MVTLTLPHILNGDTRYPKRRYSSVTICSRVCPCMLLWEELCVLYGEISWFSLVLHEWYVSQSLSVDWVSPMSLVSLYLYRCVSQSVLLNICVNCRLCQSVYYVLYLTQAVLVDMFVPCRSRAVSVILKYVKYLSPLIKLVWIRAVCLC